MTSARMLYDALFGSLRARVPADRWPQGLGKGRRGPLGRRRVGMWTLEVEMSRRVEEMPRAL